MKPHVAHPLVLQSIEVRALREGHLSQVRVPVTAKQTPPGRYHFDGYGANGRGQLLARFETPGGDPDPGMWHTACPFGDMGTTTWVREPWYQPVGSTDRRPNPHKIVAYAADHDRTQPAPRYRRACHMPRWASRYRVTVTGIRLLRLHEVSNEDAVNLGAPFWWDDLPYENAKAHGNVWTDIAVREGWKKHAPDWRGAFGAMWVDLHGKKSWESNLWCWTLGVELVKL